MVRGTIRRFREVQVILWACGMVSLLLSCRSTMGPGADQTWTSLFDGKTLDGWVQKTGNAKYYVKDSCLVGEMVAPGNGFNSFLCTTKEYDNFILELEFKVDAAINSGVQIRSQYADKPVTVQWQGRTINIRPGYVYGYQVEIDTNLKGKAWTGGIYDERRRGNYLDPNDGQNGKLGQEFTKRNREIVKPDDWNTLRIEAVGSSFKTYVNGVPRANVTDSLTPKGFIGLQVHNSNDTAHNGALAWFRNIRIMPAAAAPSTTLNTLSEQEKKDGWRLLWDGKTTEGWRSPKSEDFPQKSWVIKDGELTVVAGGNAESQAGGDIITRERFSNFELVVDFKTSSGCNSGVKYFVQPNLDPITGAGAKAAVGSAIGLEYQILDDANHPDAKLGRNGNRTLGSLYDLIPPAATKKPNPIGQWNTARIVVKGSHVEHWLNGDRILEYERGSPAFKAFVAQSKFKTIPGFGEWPDGHILLQEHGSQVAFRNVKIRKLSGN